MMTTHSLVPVFIALLEEYSVSIHQSLMSLSSDLYSQHYFHLLLSFKNCTYTTGVHMGELFWLNNKVSLVAEIALLFGSLQEMRVQRQDACHCCIKVENVL